MTFMVRPFVLAANLLAVLALTSCGSDPTQVVAVHEQPAEAESAEATQLADPPPPTTAPGSTTTPASTTRDSTAAPENTTAPTNTTAPPAIQPNEDIEVLGPTMMGVGEWVAIRPTREPVTDCDSDATLGYSVDGTIVHRYDELGGLGGIRLFPGPFGQDAFVINCEESIERILIQGSAFMPGQGWPELADFTMYSAEFGAIVFDYATGFGWGAGWFTAHGIDTSRTPATTDLYGFDASAGKIVAVADRIGKRTAVGDREADLVVPTGWMFGTGTTSHPDSLSRVQVTGRTDASYEPLDEGDDFLSSDSVDVRIWSTPDADGRASVVRAVTATDWTFLSNDGVRVVRLIPVNDGLIEVELFADSTDGSIDQDLPWLVLDMVRVFEG